MTVEEDRDLYGPSRPLWQRIIIYIFFTVALLVLVLYFLLPNKGKINTKINDFLYKPTPTAVNLDSRYVVKIQNFDFDPGVMSIKVGQSITWLNLDAVSQSAVADDKSFNTGILDINESKTIYFDKPGIYTYYDGLHPEIHGKVIVKQY